ncbi:H1_5 [Mytilus coruscus]|uniref:H1_5 n=1 Tax=Mytilus coruscus TaxID=42192 RepID=A0A6J8BV61_MYTCO|nr:H1_5 [Mytilus coruscus]
MSDAPVVVKTPAKSPKKKAAAKPKKVATHPKYSEMRCKNSQHSLEVSFEIRRKSNSLKQSKGTGASGSFKIGEVAKPAKKPAKKAVKPKAAKPKKAKTPKRLPQRNLQQRNQLVKRKQLNQKQRNQLPRNPLQNPLPNLQRKPQNHQKVQGCS